MVEARIGQLNATSGQSFRFILVNAEQSEEVHHLEYFDGEWRRIYQFRVSAKLFGSLKRIYDGSNPGRVHHWHRLEVEDKKGMVACERSPDCLVELIDSFPHLERALHADGTGISVL
jgi:hypothetical protein